MTTLPMTTTKYRVTRFCCQSGMCTECRAWANGTKRIRVMQLETTNKARAEECAKSFAGYGSKLEKVTS